MTAIVACMVCAGPLESLLSNGLHAGVLAMAVVAAAVIAALARGAMLVVREDRRLQRDGLDTPGGGS